MGQKSPRYTRAQIFTKIALITLIINALNFNTIAAGSKSPQERPSATITVTQLANNDWYATINLSCAIGGGEVSTTSQFVGQPGFDAFSDETMPALNGLSITYRLSGPSSTLPAGVDVAVITLADDDCGEVHTWQVSTDGGGTMLILDEF